MKEATTMRSALGLTKGQPENCMDELLEKGEMWITFDAFLR